MSFDDFGLPYSDVDDPGGIQFVSNFLLQACIRLEESGEEGVWSAKVSNSDFSKIMLASGEIVRVIFQRDGDSGNKKVVERFVMQNPSTGQVEFMEYE